MARLLRVYPGPGFDEQVERLRRMSGADGTAIMAEAMRLVLDTSVAVAKIYPPELPGQRWIRGVGYVTKGGRVIEPSQQLGDSWQATVDVKRGSVTGILENFATYSTYVMGRRHQSSIHQGRWRTIEDITDQVTALAREKLEQTANQMANNIERG